MVEAHKRTPFSTFEILTDPDAAGRVHDLPACHQDPYTKSHLRKFDTVAKLNSDDAKAKLLGAAYCATTSIAPIEARHAQLRRITELKSASLTKNIGVSVCRLDTPAPAPDPRFQG